MKKQYILLGTVAVLIAGGLWLSRPAGRIPAGAEPDVDVGREEPTGAPPEVPPGRSQPDPMLRPPEPNRRFSDFTPEQRVGFARQGHGPGG